MLFDLRMQLVWRFIAAASLAAVASCGHNALAPSQGGTALFAGEGAPPPTIHVVPFYDYGKFGYEPLGGGSSYGSLIGGKAALYGTTVLGGDSACSTEFDTGSSTGCGVVYRLVPKPGKGSYKFEVLHTFTGAPSDGAASLATLFADKRGDLYGATMFGGEYNAGTLFKLHPSSSGYTETIVHNFGYGTDGAYPTSGVIEINGTLYGTTQGGGTYTKTICMSAGSIPNGTCGTVYRINPATGVERVLHSFGKFGDGENPAAAPLAVGNTLYGTTDLGGSVPYCGTVYKIGIGGKGERVIHDFQNAGHGDGCNPFASLIALNGTLYGTTCCGGGNFCAYHCEGTLFSVDIATGKETVLHEFGEPGDGSEPRAAVVSVQGVLYGTTVLGGLSTCSNGYGCGSIFSFTPSSSSAAYSLLYVFQNLADGAEPTDTLLYSDGAFYGTTTLGGKKGRGTAIRLHT